MTVYKNVINGELVDGDMGTQPVFNPATGEETAQVHLSGKAIVDQAVAAAKEALPAWANMPPLKRARIMFNYKALLKKTLMPWRKRSHVSMVKPKKMPVEK